MTADDLIGQRIGMLTVFSEVEPGTDTRGHLLRRFVCRCDCGTEKIVNFHNLKTNRFQSCGCTRFKKKPPVDLTGQQFGKLTVISEAEAYYQRSGNKKRRWLCKCECGRETIVLQSNLTSQSGTRSCGCLAGKNGAKGITRILTGNRYGKLLVIGPAEPQKTTIGGMRKRWQCQCDCGSTTIVAQDNLLCGHTRSCGCMKHDGLKRWKVGLLTPKKRIPGTRDWSCLCACGNQITVNQDDLFWGTVTDCGCRKTKSNGIRAFFRKYVQKRLCP